ncbi:MAG: purine-nucleoside phosphorylase [candidate division KSB1 bacterium]|nr:purine-nucleoside phosphorylase [candidate division KSB1 bacterium]
MKQKVVSSKGTTSYKQQILEVVEFLQQRLPSKPPIGIILGTGLGGFADLLQEAGVIPYHEIPHLPQSTVKFHAGRLVFGRLGAKKALVMQGRFHYYEGYSMQQIVLPVRAMALLGIRTLIVTNAVGGLRPHLTPGTLALITDHLNLMGDNPLIGPHDELYGARFPDMSEAYSRRLRQLALETAALLQLPLAETVYAAVSGPSYETAAEVRMLQMLGADTVGMSVVPEVLAARQMGMEILGISAVTDQALPQAMQPVTHEDVSRVAQETAPKFNMLLTAIIERL